MDGALLAFALKLPLALLVFLIIAYAGTTDKRIAGVLLTFPILNGIAIIASPEPIVVADAIYPLVIFNCVLFGLVISFPRRAAAGGARSRDGAKLFARVAVWSLIWLAGAFLITDFRAAIPGAGCSPHRVVDFRDPVHAVLLDEAVSRRPRAADVPSTGPASHRSGIIAPGSRASPSSSSPTRACSSRRVSRSTRNGSAWRARCRSPASSRSPR